MTIDNKLKFDKQVDKLYKSIAQQLKKVEHIQEGALCFMFNDKVSTYESLLDRYGYTSLHIK